MDLYRFLSVLVVLCLDGSEGGGHGGKHHDHVKIYMPKFIHHDRHTKMITIHHHHHKPKEQHHHKPHFGHHFHHHNKVLSTSSKSHGSHGHNHGLKITTIHKGHDRHHGHPHHGHHGGGHHHDYPSISYEPGTVGVQENYGSYTPSVASGPSYVGGSVPQVHGIQHTIEQVKAYASLPGVIKPSAGGSPGYQVTEEAEDDGDSFTSINGLQQVYPATYGYLRGAAPQPSQNTFAELGHTTAQIQGHAPFAGLAQPTAALGSIDPFTGTVLNEPYSSSAPTQSLPTAQSSQYPTAFQAEGFEDSENSFVGDSDISSNPHLAADENTVDHAPTSFHREAGIQQTIKTGGVETVLY